MYKDEISTVFEVKMYKYLKGQEYPKKLHYELLGFFLTLHHAEQIVADFFENDLCIFYHDLETEKISHFEIVEFPLDLNLTASYMPKSIRRFNQDGEYWNSWFMSDSVSMKELEDDYCFVKGYLVEIVYNDEIKIAIVTNTPINKKEYQFLEQKFKEQSKYSKFKEYLDNFYPHNSYKEYTLLCYSNEKWIEIYDNHRVFPLRGKVTTELQEVINKKL